MPDKAMRMTRAAVGRGTRRPVLLAIAGDSAAGKTTLTRGLVQALGEERCVAVCVDDYHRLDRMERKDKSFTALHPDCNYVEIMEQHLQLLATGQPSSSRCTTTAPASWPGPSWSSPTTSSSSRGRCRCSPSWPGRASRWRCSSTRRSPSGAAGRWPGTPPSAATPMLRPTIRHPDLTAVLVPTLHRAIHLKLERDPDGRPCDTLHVHGYVPTEESQTVQKAIWASLDQPGELPSCLGRLTQTRRSEPMAITQLLLLYHLLSAAC